MLAGKIRYKADLYKNIGEPNNPKLEYYKTINVQIQKRSGSHTIQAFQLWNTKTLLLRIRMRNDIDETMFVKIKDDFFFISDIQPDSGYNGDLMINLVLSNYED